MPFRNEIKCVAVLSRTETQVADRLLLLLHMLWIQAGHKHSGKKQKQLGECRGWWGIPTVQN